MRRIIFLIITAVNFFLYNSLKHYAADDLYIHLRIAENLYSYGLPYYNISEPVNGSSSPVWVLLLTVIHILPFDPLTVISVINAFVITALILCIHQFLQNRVYTFLSIIPFYALAFQQMESTLACLLVIAGMNMEIKGRKSGLFYFSLAACTRLEFSVLWGAFFVYKLIHKQKSLIKEIIFSIIPAAVYLFYNLYFFGEILPQTIKAKSIVYDINNRIFFKELALVFSADKFLSYKILYFISLLISVLYSLKYFIRRGEKAAPYIVSFCAISIFVVYYFKGVMIFPWYLILIAGPAFCSLLYIAKTNQSMSLLFFVFIALVPFLKVMLINLYAGFFNPAYYSDYFRSARVGQYLNTGQAIRQICPDCIVMAPEVGGLGYNFKGRILDAVGLVTPQALKFHPLPVPQSRYSGSVGAIPGDFVEEAKPDIIVSLEIFLKDYKKHKICSSYKAVSVSPFKNEDAENLKGKTLWASDSLLLLFNRQKFTDEMIVNIESMVNLNSPAVINHFKCK